MSVISRMKLQVPSLRLGRDKAKATPDMNSTEMAAPLVVMATREGKHAKVKASGPALAPLARILTDAGVVQTTAKDNQARQFARTAAGTAISVKADAVGVAAAVAMEPDIYRKTPTAGNSRRGLLSGIKKWATRSVKQPDLPMLDRQRLAGPLGQVPHHLVDGTVYFTAKAGQQPAPAFTVGPGGELYWRDSTSSGWKRADGESPEESHADPALAVATAQTDEPSDRLRAAASGTSEIQTLEEPSDEGLTEGNELSSRLPGELRQPSNYSKLGPQADCGVYAVRRHGERSEVVRIAPGPSAPGSRGPHVETRLVSAKPLIGLAVDHDKTIYALESDGVLQVQAAADESIDSPKQEFRLRLNAAHHREALPCAIGLSPLEDGAAFIAGDDGCMYRLPKRVMNQQDREAPAEVICEPVGPEQLPGSIPGSSIRDFATTVDEAGKATLHAYMHGPAGERYSMYFDGQAFKPGWRLDTGVFLRDATGLALPEVPEQHVFEINRDGVRLGHTNGVLHLSQPGQPWQRMELTGVRELKCNPLGLNKSFVLQSVPQSDGVPTSRVLRVALHNLHPEVAAGSALRLGMTTEAPQPRTEVLAEGDIKAFAAVEGLGEAVQDGTRKLCWVNSRNEVFLGSAGADPASEPPRPLQFVANDPGAVEQMAFDLRGELYAIIRPEGQDEPTLQRLVVDGTSAQWKNVTPELAPGHRLVDVYNDRLGRLHIRVQTPAPEAGDTPASPKDQSVRTYRFDERQGLMPVRKKDSVASMAAAAGRSLFLPGVKMPAVEVKTALLGSTTTSRLVGSNAVNVLEAKAAHLKCLPAAPKTTQRAVQHALLGRRGLKDVYGGLSDVQSWHARNLRGAGAEEIPKGMRQLLAVGEPVTSLPRVGGDGSLALSPTVSGDGMQVPGADVESVVRSHFGWGHDAKLREQFINELKGAVESHSVGLGSLGLAIHTTDLVRDLAERSGRNFGEASVMLEKLLRPADPTASSSESKSCHELVRPLVIEHFSGADVSFGPNVLLRTRIAAFAAQVPQPQREVAVRKLIERLTDASGKDAAKALQILQKVPPALLRQALASDTEAAPTTDDPGALEAGITGRPVDPQRVDGLAAPPWRQAAQQQQADLLKSTHLLLQRIAQGEGRLDANLHFDSTSTSKQPLGYTEDRDIIADLRTWIEGYAASDSGNLPADGAARQEMVSLQTILSYMAGEVPGTSRMFLPYPKVGAGGRGSFEGPNGLLLAQVLHNLQSLTELHETVKRVVSQEESNAGWDRTAIARLQRRHADHPLTRLTALGFNSEAHLESMYDVFRTLGRAMAKRSHPHSKTLRSALANDGDPAATSVRDRARLLLAEAKASKESKTEFDPNLLLKYKCRDVDRLIGKLEYLLGQPGGSPLESMLQEEVDQELITRWADRLMAMKTKEFFFDDRSYRGGIDPVMWLVNAVHAFAYGSVTRDRGYSILAEMLGHDPDGGDVAFFAEKSGGTALEVGAGTGISKGEGNWFRAAGLLEVEAKPRSTGKGMGFMVPRDRLDRFAEALFDLGRKGDHGIDDFLKVLEGTHENEHYEVVRRSAGARATAFLRAGPNQYKDGFFSAQRASLFHATAELATERERYDFRGVTADGAPKFGTEAHKYRSAGAQIGFPGLRYRSWLMWPPASDAEHQIGLGAMNTDNELQLGSRSKEGTKTEYRASVPPALDDASWGRFLDEALRDVPAMQQRVGELRRAGPGTQSANDFVAGLQRLEDEVAHWPADQASRLALGESLSLMRRQHTLAMQNKPAVFGVIHELRVTDPSRLTERSWASWAMGVRGHQALQQSYDRDPLSPLHRMLEADPTLKQLVTDLQRLHSSRIKVRLEMTPHAARMLFERQSSGASFSEKDLLAFIQDPLNLRIKSIAVLKGSTVANGLSGWPVVGASSAVATSLEALQGSVLFEYGADGKMSKWILDEAFARKRTLESPLGLAAAKAGAQLMQT